MSRRDPVTTDPEYAAVLAERGLLFGPNPLRDEVFDLEFPGAALAAWVPLLGRTVQLNSGGGRSSWLVRRIAPLAPFGPAGPAGVLVTLARIAPTSP